MFVVLSYFSLYFLTSDGHMMSVLKLGMNEFGAFIANIYAACMPLSVLWLGVCLSQAVGLLKSLDVLSHNHCKHYSLWPGDCINVTYY